MMLNALSIKMMFISESVSLELSSPPFLHTKSLPHFHYHLVTAGKPGIDKSEREHHQM